MSKAQHGLRFCVALGISSGTLLSGCGLGDLLSDLKNEAEQGFDAGTIPDGDQGGQDQQKGTPQPTMTQTSSNMIGMQGGQVVTRSGALNVPQGALPSDTQVTVSEVNEGAISAPVPQVLQAAAPAVAFTPHGLTFSSPVTLTLYHQAGSNNVVVLRLDNEQDQTWERVDGVQAGPNSVNIVSTHFSIYNVSTCDPGRDQTGLCKALLSGPFDISSLTSDALKAFDAPDNFGLPSTGGSDGSGSSGGSCPKKCETQIDCVPPNSLPDPSMILEPPPDAGLPENPPCVEVEHEVCWEDCSQASGSGGGLCPPPPKDLPAGCVVQRADNPCGYIIACEGTGGSGGGYPGGSSGGSSGGQQCPPPPKASCYYKQPGDCFSLVCDR